MGLPDSAECLFVRVDAQQGSRLFRTGNNPPPYLASFAIADGIQDQVTDRQAKLCLARIECQFALIH